MSSPILYPSTETEFTTNGIGLLPDAVSCTVTEERNGQFELEMQYPVTGLHYPELKLRRLLVAKPNPTATPQPFRIYRVTRPMGGLVTVCAEHISYDLNGIAVSPFTAGSAAGAMAAFQAFAATDCPFTFWTDKSTVANMTVDVPASIRSLLFGQRGSVLDVYGGGDYEFDRFTVRLHGHRGQNHGVSIRYGKNLTDLEQDENCASVYTGVYPYWKGAEEDSAVVTLPERIVNAPGTYDFTRILALDLSAEWQEAPAAEQLRARTQRYIEDNRIGVPKVSLRVEFAQLEQSPEYADKALFERVLLCDDVNVEFPALGVSATAQCVRTVWNVLLDRYDSLELGDARTSLADTLLQQQEQLSAVKEESKTFFQQAVENATALITGNKGGYVVFHRSAGQEWPDEILVMDTPDIEMATNVWRFNQAGLGHSSTGYNGPYGLAMTMDGSIVASFITSGILTAGLIRAGILTNVKMPGDAEVFFLDLDAGIVRMNASSLKSGGKDVATQEYANTQISASAEGIRTDVSRTLENYSTTTQMNSAISQSASNITTSVSQTYATKAQLGNYSTTTQMNSAISQSAESITLSVSQTYATKNSLGGYTKTNEVRSKFAMDSTSVNIESGNIHFKAGALSWESTNSSMTAAGSLTCKAANIQGEFMCGDPNGYWIRLRVNDDSKGEMTGGNGQQLIGYINYAGSTWVPGSYSPRPGIVIKCDTMQLDTDYIATTLKNSNLPITCISGNGTVNYVKDVSLNSDGTLNITRGSIQFTNGIMTTAL